MITPCPCSRLKLYVICLPQTSNHRGKGGKAITSILSLSHEKSVDFTRSYQLI